MFCKCKSVVKTLSLNYLSCRRIGTNLPKKFIMEIQVHLRPVGHDPLPESQLFSTKFCIIIISVIHFVLDFSSRLYVNLLQS